MSYLCKSYFCLFFIRTILTLTKALLKLHTQLYYIVLEKISKCCIFHHVFFIILLMNLTNYFLCEHTMLLIIMITKCCNLFMYYTPKDCTNK